MTRTLTGLCMWLAIAVPALGQDFDPDDLATFSIIARDPATGEFGFGVQ